MTYVDFVRFSYALLVVTDVVRISNVEKLIRFRLIDSGRRHIDEENSTATEQLREQLNH